MIRSPKKVGSSGLGKPFTLNSGLRAWLEGLLSGGDVLFVRLLEPFAGTKVTLNTPV